MSLRTVTNRLALALALTFIAGCGSSADGEAPRAWFVSEQKEIEIGQSVHDQIIQESPVYTDAVLTDYVTALGEELVAVSQRPTLQHHFYVLDTEQVNAFAAPGGYVYVTIGLLRVLESRAQLAGVLGHEVAHVAASHGARTMETSLLASLIADLLIGDENATRQVVDWVVGFYQNTAHSQDFEEEADRLGVDNAYAAGYNPWGLVDFFEKLQAIVGAPDSVSAFLSSPPPPASRIEAGPLKINGLSIKKDDPTLILDDGAAPYIPYAQLQASLPAPKPDEEPADTAADPEPAP